MVPAAKKILLMVLVLLVACSAMAPLAYAIEEENQPDPPACEGCLGSNDPCCGTGGGGGGGGGLSCEKCQLKYNATYNLWEYRCSVTTQPGTGALECRAAVNTCTETNPCLTT